MKEQELDKYLGKMVEIVDCDNEVEQGELHKIVDFIDQTTREMHSINNGYYLKIFNKRFAGCDYRKSHMEFNNDR